MHELTNILAEAEKARGLGRPVALATVIEIKGSAYRLPGARMLIVDGKWVAGSISGGCLEDDVVLRAGKAIADGKVLTATYDTTSDDDIIFGVGLGCKGIITILIEPLMAAADEPDFLRFAASCIRRREVGVAATVVRIDGTVAAVVGGRMMCSSDGTSITDVGPELKARIRARMEGSALEPGLATILLEQGSVEVYLERIVPPVPLIVFGGGHDAIPVVRLAKELGWEVTVVDHRPGYVTSARFPLADKLLLAEPKDVAGNVPLAADTLALVMTHNYLRDLRLLETLMPSPIRYLGLLGPRKRIDQLLADLRKQGIQPTKNELNRLYTPVGLDIGAEAPAAVALSILAEIQAVITNHGGGSLREKKSRIHADLGPATVS